MSKKGRQREREREKEREINKRENIFHIFIFIRR
jgi:hypothetical protein